MVQLHWYQVPDITKLFGPAKWTYFCLCVILDVFSRYVVRWIVAIPTRLPGMLRTPQGCCSFSQEFFAWTNDEHRRSGLGLHAPPERFVRKPPQPSPAPKEVWINKLRPIPEKQNSVNCALPGVSNTLHAPFGNRKILMLRSY
jgi:hypothetical protein